MLHVQFILEFFSAFENIHYLSWKYSFLEYSSYSENRYEVESREEGEQRALQTVFSGK